MPSDQVPSVVPFDYAAIDKGLAHQARTVVERFRLLAQRTAIDGLEIGHELNTLKGRMEHGTFGRWLAAEFGMTARTAQNMMSAAKRFEGKYEIISHLPQTTIFMLAAPSTPEPVCLGVIERLEAGKIPATNAIASEIDEAKAAAKQARIAKLPPEQRDAEEAKAREKAEKRKRKQEERGRDAAVSPERQVERAEITKKLLPAIAKLLKPDDARRIVRLIERLADISLDVESYLATALAGVPADAPAPPVLAENPTSLAPERPEVAEAALSPLPGGGLLPDAADGSAAARPIEIALELVLLLQAYGSVRREIDKDMGAEFRVRGIEFIAKDLDEWLTAMIGASVVALPEYLTHRLRTGYANVSPGPFYDQRKPISDLVVELLALVGHRPSRVEVEAQS